jgi:hypothetical protein
MLNIIINAEKNRSKDIQKEWKLYKSILSKYRYTSLELGGRERSAASCPALLKDNPSATYRRSLDGLCTTGLLWARLPCFIEIGNKLSWGNLS